MSLLIITFIFGLFWGSFLNVLIDRLANNESLWGRSRCDHCRNVLGFFDLWPIISFCALLGRCRYCQNSIPRQHLVVEVLTAVLFTFGAYHLQNLNLSEPLVFLKYGILLSGLLVIGFQDYKYMIIMDVVIYSIAVPIFLINLFLGWPILNMLLATGLLIVFFGAQYLISKGRWLGSGDIWLGGLLGLAFGWPNALEVIIWGYVIGAIISLVMLVVKKKEWGSQMPLGTFLSAAGILYLLVK